MPTSGIPRLQGLPTRRCLEQGQWDFVLDFGWHFWMAFLNGRDKRNKPISPGLIPGKEAPPTCLNPIHAACVCAGQS